MYDMLGMVSALLAQQSIWNIWNGVWPYLVIFAGFSAVIFVHELGHFAAAKWADVKVERFAIGFFSELFGFTRGETRYSFNVLPLGGYVKMLGQEDFDDKSEELRFREDPRAFGNKAVYKRMVIVSAGVIMNIIFAALLFVVVFMQGKSEITTTVGKVMPETPAAFGGIQPGDIIKRINDQDIRSYQEIKFAVLLADPHEPLRVYIDRDGAERKLEILPEPDDHEELLQIGIAPATTQEVILPVSQEFDPQNPTHLHSGDKIIAINGTPVDPDSRGGIDWKLRSENGTPTLVSVERPDPKNADQSQTLDNILVFNSMFVHPSDPLEDPTSRNLLGLTPPVRVLYIAEKSRAEIAGIKRGDVILEFGGIRFPTAEQIAELVRDSRTPPPEDEVQSWRGQLYHHYTWDPESDIPLTVLRDGEEIPLVLRPKIDGKKRPADGMQLGGIAEDTLRVAGIDDTIHGRTSPAKSCGIDPGSLINSVNGDPVRSWPHLAERFQNLAGTTIKLGYDDPDGVANVCDFPVPDSPLHQLGLSTLGKIESVDGERSVLIDTVARRKRLSVNHPEGLYISLKRKLEANDNQPMTVKVEYREQPWSPIKEATLDIAPDSIDPWVNRVNYQPFLVMREQRQILKADGPIEALAIGVKKTWYFIMNVYVMMERMIVSRSVGVKQLSGPVGIVHVGGQFAKAGLTEFLYFLAMISANLAVINFLPLPIVDGGLMVFLIVEKIKGSPVSLQVQVATQVIGLFLLGAAFLFVTFQDVIRLAG